VKVHWNRDQERNDWGAERVPALQSSNVKNQRKREKQIEIEIEIEDPTALSGHLPQVLHNIGNSEARLGHLLRLLHDHIGGTCVNFAQLVRVIAELFQMLSALLHRVRGEIIFADRDDARDDRDDLRDVLAKVRWRGRTAEPDNDVLNGPYNGIGLSFEIRF